MYQITGTIIKMFDRQQITDSFAKRTIVIKTNDKYPQEVPIEFVNDSIDLLNGFTLKEKVQISINIRGNKDKRIDRWYSSLNGWKIESYAEEVMSKDQIPNREENDLPF